MNSASQRVPESMNRYALKDGDKYAGNGKADDKVVAPKEDAAELDNGKNAVLEEDAKNSSSLDVIILD